jgi:hypothetical protein
MSKFVRTCLGIMCGLLIMITSMESKGLKNNLSIQDESIAFKCLLNIPMGISPAELKTYLSECQGITMFDVSQKNITQSLDLSSFSNQVLYNLDINTYIEGQDSLSQLTFSFFKGGLFFIEGIKLFDDYETDEERTKHIVAQFEEHYGTPRYTTKTIYWQTWKGKVKIPNWSIGNKTLSFDTYFSPPEGYFTLKNDSLFKIVNEIKNSEVHVEVFTYSGSDPKEKQSISSWAYNNGEGSSYINPKIITYCEGVGRIKLKGKGKDLTFTILCDNGNVVFEKKGIVLKGSTQILKKDEFPNVCESYEVDGGETYTNYTLIVSKKGHTLFSGNILRKECQD